MLKKWPSSMGFPARNDFFAASDSDGRREMIFFHSCGEGRTTSFFCKLEEGPKCNLKK